MTPGSDSRHSAVASSSRSSTELSHRSPNRVQPIATTATLSAMPWLVIEACLPEVVVDRAGGEQPSECEVHPRAHRETVWFSVGDLEGAAAAAVDIDHRLYGRRRRRVGQAVDGVGADGTAQPGDR